MARWRPACLPLRWEGSGREERGVSERDGRTRVALDPAYLRPAEAHALRGDASLARERIGWEAAVRFDEVVERMVAHDLAQARREAEARR